MAVFKLGNIIGFDWDQANIEHIARHNVLPKETEDVFFDKNNILAGDLKHSTGEQRFLIIGKTRKGRILYQVFTVRGSKIRVISSRDINKKEVSLYEKKANHTKV